MRHATVLYRPGGADIPMHTVCVMRYTVLMGGMSVTESTDISSHSCMLVLADMLQRAPDGPAASCCCRARAWTASLDKPLLMRCWSCAGAVQAACSVRHAHVGPLSIKLDFRNGQVSLCDGSHERMRAFWHAPNSARTSLKWVHLMCHGSGMHVTKGL